MDFERELNKLNSSQKRAVDLIDGPLIVIAGPGTGKTQLLSMRTANILRKTDIQPENILCLTFTEAASENMRSRLIKLVGKSANHVGIYTFHGFGEHIIRNYPEYFYEAPLLNQLNELGEYDLLEKIMSKLHHDNPLAKKVNGAYLHLPTIIRTISWLKQAGLNPDDLRVQIIKDQSFFEASNKFISTAFDESPSSKQIKKYESLLKSLLDLQTKYPSETAKKSTLELALAIDELDAKSRYAQSITAWRNKWLLPIKKGSWRYADQQKNTFLLHVANLYESYQEKLTLSGQYTFDDMILRTTNALSKSEELRLVLQEKYQYILVDEYQDTNGAQDKILTQLSDNPVNEGKPNLMVVGDDDQAIYRFQGANSSVMQDFINRWNPERIVLTDSYRSSQDLLDLARSVIVNADDRLEATDAKINKLLVSKVKVKDAKISELFSSSESENYVNTASKIKNLIDGGTKPSSIAVLAPKHRYLEELVPYLLKNNIPINYERRQQVLNQPRIIEVLDLVELISAGSHLKTSRIEALLPKILASEYWQLTPDNLWDIALLAQKDRQGWLSVISKSKNKDLRNLADSIKILSKRAKNQSFELILAYLTGRKSIKLSNDELWEFPWRDYYFSQERLKNDPAGYISFMSQLDTLNQSFQEWLPDESKLQTIEDFEAFINLYRRTKIKLDDNSPYTTGLDAVNLMTVYKSKGLEWDTVFVLNTQEDVWGSKARSRNQSFSLPSTLKWIEPAVDTSNDLIRLFYVSVTRAMRQLYLTSYSNKDNGQPAEKLLWLQDLLPELNPLPALPDSVIVAQYEYQWQDVYKTPSNDLKILLKPVLESYRLSSTHLNDFLAVDRGGPKFFFYRHILKVPEELNPSAMYGDSIHKTLEYVHKQINHSKPMPKISEITEFFIKHLTDHPFTKEEYRYFKKRGEDNLSQWLANNGNKFQKSDASEYDFSGERIIIGDALLTGKIDVVRKLDNDEYSVIDYKTSTPIDSWTGHNSVTSIRANNYKNQLMFYKLLVDNSVNIGRKATAKLGIIEFTTPDDENNFSELAYTYNSLELDRLKKLIAVIWSKITSLDFPDTDKYPATLKGIRAFEDDLINGEV